jgi:hypothetical protein
VAELGYYEVRAALAFHFSTVVERLATRRAGAETLPATVQLIRTVATRFGVVVSDKAAAQLMPVLGAAAGGIVNGIFLQHFMDVARGHFIMRRLERHYDPAIIEAAYQAMAEAERAAHTEFTATPADTA